MADPLSLLRQFNVNKKEINKVNDYICFGEYCWPKTVKTNYVVYTSSRDGPNKEYYTLECLLFLLNNVNLPHPIYVKQAAAEGVPVVRRPDRKDLLAYLIGDTVTSNSIDRSATLELPITYTDVLKVGNDSHQQASNLNSISSVDIANNIEDDITPNKIAKLDVMQKAKEQFSARLDAPKLKKTISTLAGENLTSDPSLSAPTASLSEALSIEQINALKAKRLAKKRSTIIDAENEFDKDSNQISGAATGSSILFRYDASFTKEIQSKERVWRNRSTILQSSGKNFAKSIFPILQSIKNREEGIKKPGNSAMNNFNLATPLHRQQSISLTSYNQPLNQQQQYNRYDQERFNRSDPAIGFKIDTTGTYHGLQLKNVTEGSVTPKSMPGTPLQINSNLTPNSAQKPQKRVSRTPIIIVPATPTSLITINNSKFILQDLKYIDNKTAGDRKETDVLIQRKKNDGSISMYRIIDNPLKLLEHDWNRVVAVFVQGPAWQFKGWPWNGNPVDIFSKIKAFHLKFDEMKLDNNVAKWNVEVIELSRNKRHLDRANLLKFWSMLDQHMIKKIKL